MTHNESHVIDVLPRVGSSSNGVSCRSGTDPRLLLVDPTPTSDLEISSVASFFIYFCGGCVRVVVVLCFFIFFVFRSSCNVGVCPRESF